MIPRARLGQLVDGNIGDFKWENSLVDVALFSFGAANRDGLARLERTGRSLRADDGGNSDLPRDDCRMARPASLIGHDRGGLLHDRFPIGIRLFGDENFAGLKLAKIVRVENHSRAPGPDRFSDAAAAGRAACPFLSGDRFSRPVCSSATALFPGEPAR